MIKPGEISTDLCSGNLWKGEAIFDVSYSAKRTKVYDDECDYFSTDANAWLSEKEKAALQKRESELRAVRHASRKDCKITLDFAGRQVREVENVVDMYSAEDEVVQEIHFGAKRGGQETEPEFSADDFVDLVNPNLSKLKIEAPKVSPLQAHADSIAGSCSFPVLNIHSLLTVHSSRRHVLQSERHLKPGDWSREEETQYSHAGQGVEGDDGRRCLYEHASTVGLPPHQGYQKVRLVSFPVVGSWSSDLSRNHSSANVDKTCPLNGF